MGGTPLISSTQKQCDGNCSLACSRITALSALGTCVTVGTPHPALAMCHIFLWSHTTSTVHAVNCHNAILQADCFLLNLTFQRAQVELKLQAASQSPSHPFCTHKLLRSDLQVLSPLQATGILPPPQARSSQSESEAVAASALAGAAVLRALNFSSFL